MNKEQQDFFMSVLANPGSITAHHAEKIEALVLHYPQSNVLHALLALAYKNSERDVFEQKLQTASAYASDRTVLYRLINNPDSLFRQVRRPVDVNDTHHQTDVEPTVQAGALASVPEAPVAPPVPVNTKPVADATDSINFFHIKDEEAAGNAKQVDLANSDKSTLEFASNDPFAAIEFKPEQGAPAVKHFHVDTVEAANSESVSQPQIIAAPVATANPEGVAVKNNDAVNRDDDERLSKYHDDKMPYTFMWWLSKTRKEHADVYQPYAPTTQFKPAEAKPALSDALQQQYYENIFHITSVEELEQKNAKQAIQFGGGTKRKSTEIIERFIQKEPQIQPPSTARLDNENKAVKSSEDQDEIISETLARIYTDQMLYHKAIATYQKLILKFPEKRTYFAGKIELLEKKITK